jgi:hypothetical protein
MSGGLLPWWPGEWAGDGLLVCHLTLTCRCVVSRSEISEGDDACIKMTVRRVHPMPRVQPSLADCNPGSSLAGGPGHWLLQGTFQDGMHVKRLGHGEVA